MCTNNDCPFRGETKDKEGCYEYKDIGEDERIENMKRVATFGAKSFAEKINSIATTASEKEEAEIIEMLNSMTEEDKEIVVTTSLFADDEV
jgi:hypothetical protein